MSKSRNALIYLINLSYSTNLKYDKVGSCGLEQKQHEKMNNVSLSLKCLMISSCVVIMIWVIQRSEFDSCPEESM